MKQYHKRGRAWGRVVIPLSFILPFLILFTLFTIIPVIAAIGLSFTDYDLISTFNFVGINNYRRLFLEDEVFFIALRNTFTFAVITGPIGFFASFFMAWVIDQLKFRNIFSLAFYAPSLTSSIAMSVVWLYFFASDHYGLINYTLIRMGILSEPIAWTMDPKTILPVIMIISIWMSMGTGFLVFLAGFQNLPSEQFEAARIDGVNNRFQELIYITLPLMKPQLLFGAINSITGAFAVFDVAVAVTPLPSPSYAGHTIVAHLYDYAFIRFDMGYSAAVSVVLFVITFGLGKLFTRLLSSKD